MNQCLAPSPSDCLNGRHFHRLQFSGAARRIKEREEKKSGERKKAKSKYQECKFSRDCKIDAVHFHLDVLAANIVCQDDATLEIGGDGSRATVEVKHSVAPTGQPSEPVNLPVEMLPPVSPAAVGPEPDMSDAEFDRRMAALDLSELERANPHVAAKLAASHSVASPPEVKEREHKHADAVPSFTGSVQFGAYFSSVAIPALVAPSAPPKDQLFDGPVHTCETELEAHQRLVRRALLAIEARERKPLDDRAATIESRRKWVAKGWNPDGDDGEWPNFNLPRNNRGPNAGQHTWPGMLFGVPFGTVKATDEATLYWSPPSHGKPPLWDRVFEAIGLRGGVVVAEDKELMYTEAVSQREWRLFGISVGRTPSILQDRGDTETLLAHHFQRASKVRIYPELLRLLKLPSSALRARKYVYRNQKGVSFADAGWSAVVARYNDLDDGLVAMVFDQFEPEVVRATLCRFMQMQFADQLFYMMGTPCASEALGFRVRAPGKALSTGAPTVLQPLRHRWWKNTSGLGILKSSPASSSSPIPVT